MKLRLLPVVISVLVSSVVLFGGWFTYQSLAMENPLLEIVNKAPGVEQSQMSLSSNHVSIELTLEPSADLREIVQQITAQGASIIGKRSVQFKINNHSSSELDAWWSKALFGVAQAMETKHYAEIPNSLEKQAALLNGMTVDTEMDNKYVYIRLTQGEYSKFILLPRVPAQLGVWPNE